MNKDPKDLKILSSIFVAILVIPVVLAVILALIAIPVIAYGYFFSDTEWERQCTIYDRFIPEEERIAVEKRFEQGTAEYLTAIDELITKYSPIIDCPSSYWDYISRW